MIRTRLVRFLLVAFHAPFGHSTILALTPPSLNGVTETVRVELKLRTGGGITGVVVDYSDDAVVIAHEGVPYVFAWQELESANAYLTRRTLAIFDRGERPLTAEDHFRLGVFALKQDRKDLAADAFRLATRAGGDFASAVRSAYDEYARRVAAFSTGDDGNGLGDEQAVATGVPFSTDGMWKETDLVSGPNAEARDRVLVAYRTFGAKVQEVLGRSIVGIESEHFLIWTDWSAANRHRLADWCEAMYAALAAQFGVDEAEHVFLAKCPVFCFRGEKRFQRFARYFDGYEGVGAIGYTRSIEANGHVHVVLLRQGRSVVDFDAFASTLVHEGTHAFLHRLYSSKLIPHWVNEGLAELMAERVLGDRCQTGEKADLLARQFARYGWPIGTLLTGTGPIEVHEYPIAHSVIRHLERQGPEKLAAFVRRLKSGETVPSSLAASYDGMTLDGLEREWRAAALTAGTQASPGRDPSDSGQ